MTRPVLNRQRLLDQLQPDSGATLHLLCAPAGFGKTELLEQWAEANKDQRSVARHSVTPADNDDAVFLQHLALAVLDNDEQAQLQLTECSPEKHQLLTIGGFVDGLLDLLEKRPQPVTLLLDDFHLLEGEHGGEVLEAFLARPLTSFEIVLASRKLPALAMARHRARGSINQVDAAALLMTADETAEWLLLLKKKAKPADLLQASGGWPVVMAFALEDNDQFSGEYIEEEILAGLDKRQRSLLEDMAVLDCWSPALADALDPGRESQALLDGMKHLVPLVHRDPAVADYYRILPVLRTCLDRVCGNRHRPDDIRRRAAQWFDVEGDAQRAVECACAAGDPEYGARIFQRHGACRYMLKFGASSVRKILRPFPRAVIKAFPRLQLAQSFLLIKEGLPESAKTQIQSVRVRTRNYSTDPSGGDSQALMTDGIIVESFRDILFGTAPKSKILAQMHRIYADASEDPYLLSAYVEAASTTLHQITGALTEAERCAQIMLRHCQNEHMWFNLAFVYFHSGMIAFARGLHKDALVHYQQVVDTIHDELREETELEAMVQVLIAEARYEMNATMAAAQRLNRTLETVEKAEGWVDIFAAGFVTSAAIAYAAGGLFAAQEVLNRARQVAGRRGDEGLYAIADAYSVYYLLCAGRLVDANALYRESALGEKHETLRSAKDCSWRLRDILGLVTARLAMENNDHALAAATLVEVIDDSRGGGRVGTMTRATILQAMVRQRLGDDDGAVTLLGDAIRLALAREHVRPFIDDSAAIMPLLNQAAESRDEKQFVASIKTTFSIESGQLNQKEMDVLQGLGLGHSNKKIAHDMGISDNTVKHYLKRLYAKLGVHKRQDAVHRAVKLDLIKTPSPLTRKEETITR